MDAASDETVAPTAGASGSTIVLALGLDATALPALGAGVESLAGEVERDHGPALVDLLRPMLTGGAHVVAISPGWFAPAARLRVEMADAALDSAGLAVHETDLPPLAGGVLAALASALGRRIAEPGVLHAALAPLEAELAWFAWLGSARGLDHPSPSLLQHASSFVPGTQYGVSSWPEPSVRRLRRHDPSIPVPPLEGPHGLVVAAQEDAPGEWAHATLAPALGIAPDPAPPSPHGARWWGTTRVVEAVAYPSDLDALAERLLARLRVRECRWCARATGAALCPLCGFDEGGAGA